MTDISPATQRLATELVAIGGPLASIVWHMQQTAAQSGGCGDAIPEILTGLLGPTLAGLCEDWPEERIADCADVVHAACARVCEDIFIVPPPNRAARRRRRPR
jgi:hypothetical protein